MSVRRDFCRRGWPRSGLPASRSTAAGTISCRSATGAPPRGLPSRPPPKASPTTETAADWVAEHGFPRPVVIGHSNGGMLAVQHVADYPQTPALVLLSAHAGGTGQVANSSRAVLMAGDRLDEITAQARAMVAAGRKHDLLLMPGWWYVASAASFLDRMVSMPAIVELAPADPVSGAVPPRRPGIARGLSGRAVPGPGRRLLRCDGGAELRPLLRRSGRRGQRDRCRVAGAKWRSQLTPTSEPRRQDHGSGTISFPSGARLAPASFRCAQANGRPIMVIASTSASSRCPIASHQPAKTNQTMLPSTLRTPASGRGTISWPNGSNV